MPTDLTTRLERLILQLPREHEATLREAIEAVRERDAYEFLACVCIEAMQGDGWCESLLDNRVAIRKTFGAPPDDLVAAVRKAAGLGPEGGE